jgi:predicted peptidase
MRFWRYALCLLLAARPHAIDEQGVGQEFASRTVTLDGSEYRYRVFVPTGWSSTVRWPVILALHGGGGYGSDNTSQIGEGLPLVIHRHPERFPAIVVLPQVPANGKPGWQDSGGRIAMAALDKTIEEFNGDPSRVALTGLSIGGNGAWYLAYHHPQRFAALLVICGFVAERMGTMYPILYPSLVPGAADPSAIVAQQLAHIPVWVFHGDADKTVPVEHSRRMVAALRAAGASVQYTELPGVDHNAWDNAYERPEVIHWLLQARATQPD